MRQYVPPLLLLCVGTLVALGTAEGQQGGRGGRGGGAAAGPKVGDKAPEIKGKDSAGKAFKLSDYRGKVVVLDFWGDW